MEEDDSAQDFSLESEQPGKRRSKDSKKDGKKKKNLPKKKRIPFRSCPEGR